MSNSAQLAEKAILEAKMQATDAIDQTLVKDVFIAFHGYYGVLFTSKYSTGEVNSDGKDKGILSTRKVWAHELQRFSRDTVGAAIDACKLENLKFPPSLPEFLAHCRAKQPSTAYKPTVPEIAMSQERRSAYARSAREINEKHNKRAMDKITGYVELPKGLDGLKQAIAGAVGAAGGDECKELLRLDRLFGIKTATHASHPQNPATPNPDKTVAPYQSNKEHSNEHSERHMR